MKQEENNLLTTREVAKILEISPSNVYRKYCAGELQGRRIKGRILFNRNDINL